MEVDHILVSTWRVLQYYSVYRSTEFCGTDHRLIVGTLWMHFKTPHLSNCHQGVPLEQIEGVCKGICHSRPWSVHSARKADGPVTLWDSFKHETLDAAQEFIGDKAECHLARDTEGHRCMSHGSTMADRMCTIHWCTRLEEGIRNNSSEILLKRLKIVS